MDYKLIRSKRKTISLELKNGEVIVRAPNRMAKRDIELFVDKHADWIERHRVKAAQRSAALNAVPKLSDEELNALAKQAAEYIPPGYGCTLSVWG